MRHILLDYDRRDAICVIMLDCWLRVALILLMNAIGAINLIVVMTSVVQLPRLVFSDVPGIKINSTLTKVHECYQSSLLTLEVVPFLRHLE